MPAKPKIAILCSFPVFLLTDALPRHTGHYGVWLLALYHAFSRQDDYEIHWVTLDKHIRQPLRFQSNGQFFHVLPRIKRPYGLVTWYHHDRKQVAAELDLIRPQLVHSWGTEDCYGLCAKYFSGKKLHSVQGALRASFQRGRLYWFARMQSYYEPLTWRSFRHITTESPWAADRVREVCPDVAPYHLEYAVEDRFFHVERHLAESPVILYSGAYTPLKNIPVLIKAFSRPELSGITLKLAGVLPGYYRNLPPNIIPLGWVGRDEMAWFLSEAWGLIHMSLADTGPTIVKEARVAGLPVIVSSECGSRQHVEHGKSGFILSPQDVDGIVTSVLAITQDAATSLRMGGHGQQECRHALCQETMVTTLLGIYRTVMHGD